MYNLHEGENFIPPGLQHVESSGSPPFNSSITSITAWLKGYLPGLSDHDRSRVLSLYPPQGSAEGLPNYNTTYVRAGIIFRDTVLACPAYWMASAAHKKSYLGEYTIGVAKHASDTIFVSWKLPARNIVTNCMCSGTKSTQSNRLTRLHTKDLPVHLLRFSRRATLMLKS
jgi:hypothetical protein